MNSKSKWIVDKLKRLGYRVITKHDTVVWMMRDDVYDACSLAIEVNDKDTYQQKATFRASSEPDIHITRYLNLRRKDGWSRLEDFEKIYARYSSSLSDPEIET